MEKILNLRQTAKRLQLTPAQTLQLFETGELRGIKCGDSWSISASQLGIAERKAKRGQPIRFALLKLKTRAEIEAEIEADFQPEPQPETKPEPKPVAARGCLPKWMRPALD